MKGHGGGRIFLLPLGTLEPALLEGILEDVKAVIPLPLTLLDAQPHPDYAGEPAGRQYDSTPILKEVLRMAPADALRIVGVTEADLFMHVLSFIFGRAQLGGKAAVVSLARLRPEFYGETPDGKRVAERAAKEIIHELGHTFGLVHCDLPECVMYLANVLRQIDRKSREFCGPCRERLDAALSAACEY